MKPLTPEQQKLAEDALQLTYYMAGQVLKSPESSDQGMIDAGVLAVVRAAGTYDPSQAAWSTYACTAIRMAFISERRDRNARAVREFNVKQVLATRPGYYEERDAVEEDERLYAARLAVRNGLRSLPLKTEQLIRRIYYEGVSPASIAREEGVTGQAIDGRLKKAFARMRLAIGERMAA